MSRALLLIGSPKPGRSASRAFAAAVESRLASRGWATRTERVSPAFGRPERTADLVAAIADSDLVVLAFPIYVDSLPAPVLGLFVAWERAAAASRLGGLHRPGTGPALAVLTLCGFPEASHCDVAIEVCRLFAQRVGAPWRGALAFGMGGSIENGIERSPLASRVGALDAAADALAAGEPIPAASTAAFARPLVPAWTYPLVGGFGWARQAKKQGCTEPLVLRRYAP
jgi:hypothetical protein